MEVWEAVLLAFGGPATMLVVLAWLARSFGSQLLARDLESFKGKLASDLEAFKGKQASDLEAFRNRLAAESAREAERLKHQLQIGALEHQIRFSKLHERRAEVVAKAYELLSETMTEAANFTAVFEWAGGPSKKEKYISTHNKLVDFYLYINKNKIFLPAKFCDELESFIQEVRVAIVGFGVHVQFDPTDGDGIKMHEAWIKASEYFSSTAPKARRILEEEFRAMIGSAPERSSVGLLASTDSVAT